LLVLIFIHPESRGVFEGAQGGGRHTTQTLQAIVTSEHIHLDCLSLMLLPILSTSVQKRSRHLELQYSGN